MTGDSVRSWYGGTWLVGQSPGENFSVRECSWKLVILVPGGRPDCVVLDDITAGKRCFDGSQNACKIHASDDSSLTRPRLSRVLPVVDKEYSAVGLV